MKKIRLLSLEYFPNFQKLDDFHEKIIREEDAVGKILNLYFLMMILSFFYGLLMGSYHSFYQAIAAGVKISVLFSLTLLICFPAFFIIQFILGSKLKLHQMLTIVLSGFVLTSALMVSFTPIIILFQLTGGNYYFLILLHIAVLGLSGIFGMRTVMDSLKYSCERKNIYPQTGVVIFRFWVVILAFVGIQLAWNFRPFLGDRGEPFKLFRKYEGNFYTAIIYSIRQLMGSDEAGMDESRNEKKEDASEDALWPLPKDQGKKGDGVER